MEQRVNEIDKRFMGEIRKLMLANGAHKNLER